MSFPVILFLLVFGVLVFRQLAGVRRRARRAFDTSVRAFIAETPSAEARRTRMRGYDVDLHRIADDDVRVVWNTREPGKVPATIRAHVALGPNGYAAAPAGAGDAGGAADSLAHQLVTEVARADRAITAGQVTDVTAAGGTTTITLHGDTPDELADSIIQALRPTYALHQLVANESRRLAKGGLAPAQHTLVPTAPHPNTTSTDTSGPFL